MGRVDGWRGARPSHFQHTRDHRGVFVPILRPPMTARSPKMREGRREKQNSVEREPHAASTQETLTRFLATLRKVCTSEVALLHAPTTTLISLMSLNGRFVDDPASTASHALTRRFSSA